MMSIDSCRIRIRQIITDPANNYGSVRIRIHNTAYRTISTVR